METEISDRDVL